MSRRRLVLKSAVASATIASFLNQVFATPAFLLAAMPGIYFSMAVSNNVHAFRPVFIFARNWIVYSVAAALVLMVSDKVRAHRDG